MTKHTIKRPEKDVSLVLDASLKADHEAALKELVKARSGAGQHMLNGPQPALEARVKDLEDEMAKSVAVFRLRAMRRREWSDLYDENPPRDGNEIDKAQGVNMGAFMDEVIPRSIVKVTWDDGDEATSMSPEDWCELADEMTDAQYQDFMDAVWELNRQKVSVPFSPAVSRNPQDSDPK